MRTENLADYEPRLLGYTPTSASAPAMRDRKGQNSRWALTGPTLDRLLALLDDDRGRAAVKYETLRARLQALLGWWGSNNAPELADRTLDRVAVKLQEGAGVSADSLVAYACSVTRLVFFESLRDAEREERARREAPQAPDPQGDVDAEPTLDALDRCLAALDVADRELILDYYRDEGGSNIAARGRLAAKLGLSITALRIRAHRLRERLERCVDEEMKRAGR